MKKYLCSSVCHGGDSALSQTGYSKLDLEMVDSGLLSLIKDSRGAPCFICAPHGFGCTTVMHAYVQSIQSYRPVFWFDGANLLFLQGLECGALPIYLFKQTELMKDELPILVIDNLPLLDELSATKLSDCIDTLIECNWEVLVGTTPAHDCFANLQSDRTLITPEQLLKGRRVDDEVAQRCFTGFFEEKLPREFLVAGALMVLLQTGSSEELRRLGFEMKDDTRMMLSSMCPLFGLDRTTGGFNVHPVSLTAFRDIFYRIFSGENGGGAKTVTSPEAARFRRVLDTASCLFERGHVRRAYEVLELYRSIAHLDEGNDALAVPASSIDSTQDVSSIHSDDMLRTTGMRLTEDVLKDERRRLTEGLQQAEDLQKLDMLTRAEPSGPGDPQRAELCESVRRINALESARHIEQIESAWKTQGAPMMYEPLPTDAVQTPCPIKETRELIAPMYVRLFGGIEVTIGERRIEEKAWSRSKAKILLSHLVLGFGREIARKTLVKYLWPAMDEKHATDNFYVTWSLMRHALSNDDGHCPYVANTGALCKIDNRYVTSDVEAFERLSRHILFEKTDLVGLVQAFLEMERLYRGDLLSGQVIDDRIAGSQARYRSLLIDAMLAATRHLIDMNDSVSALWFARKALELDSSREDVYCTLMYAQSIAGQRTSAIETFFACKRYLADELGIMPSQKTIRLYEQLISDDA